ncbi:MAG TPA: hypothetical protein VFL66_04825 [Gaiellaceae bacterium]|nr:hypothetical protein [Gaiellaceae bacterium]
MRVLPVAALVLALGAGAAHAAPARPVSPAEQYLEDQLAHRAAPEVPSGFRVRRLTDAGFAVAFPAGWQVLQRRDAVWPGAAQTLVRFDRALAPYLAALVVPDSPLALVGFDRRLPAATATVLVSRGPAGAGWARGALRTVRELPGVRGVVQRRLRLPAGAALLVRYLRGRLATSQLFVARDSRILTLTLTAPPAAAPRYAATFLAVARSLDLSVPILHP